MRTFVLNVCLISLGEVGYYQKKKTPTLDVHLIKVNELGPLTSFVCILNRLLLCKCVRGHISFHPFYITLLSVQLSFCAPSKI